jgi:hypothetical protein
MKSFLFAFLLLSSSSVMKAQAPFPDCTNLLVDSVYLSGTDLRVVLSNTCSTCASGINGAIYLEMVVTRRSNPTDTFARTNCWCYSSPDNNSQLAYTIPTLAASLPPHSDIKVALHTLCADIPFKIPSSIRSTGESNREAFYSEHSHSIVIYNNRGMSYKLYDNLGRSIRRGTISEVSYHIRTGDIPPGIYYLELNDAQTRIVKKLFVE